MSETTASKPVTPRRSSTIQALSAFFRTPTSRSKRMRSRTSSSPSQSPRTPALPAVLLQTYSVSTDSIVLTSLPSAPFCCHEDLLTMSRSQLEGVVHALNERLPRRMRIAPEDDFWWNNDEVSPADDDPISRMSEAEMRRRVEELVGIRSVKKNRVSKAGLDLHSDPAVPPAPRAVRTRGPSWKPYEITTWEMEIDGDEHQSPNGTDEALMGSSPLAIRSRTRSHHRGRSDAFPRLAILQEVNEGGESNEEEPDDDETRPSKKQRTSFETTDHRGEEPDVTQKVQGSRLIENISVSTSSLFAKEEHPPLTNFTQYEQKSLLMSDQASDDDKKPRARVQAPVLRRRSARIALKQVAPAGAEKTTEVNTHMDADVSRSSSLPTRTPLSSTGNSTQVQQKSPSQPKEFTIRLPFTSTPPHLKTTSWASSAPRILRSHSQRLSDALKPSKSTKENTTLGRSRSEKLPRALDMAFVTVDRPRYRFSRRKSKGTTTTTTQEPATLEAKPAAKVSRSNGGYKYENIPLTNDTEKDTITTTPGGIFTFLPGSLAPRSRAPSTSTIGSTCGSSDSPTQSMHRGGTGRQIQTVSTMNDGADGVRAALGKMVVD